MAKQILHLVFGGELTALDKVEFRDLNSIHFVGLYPSFSKAKEAWKSAAQATVDNAHMRYFVVHLHRLLQPELELERASVKAPKKSNGTKSRSGEPKKLGNVRPRK